MKQSRKQRRRSKQNVVVSENKDNNCDNNGGIEEQRIIEGLVEAFSLASIEEAQAAYREANGDPNKAADILSDNSEAYQASCSSSNQSSNGGSSSTSSNGDTVACAEFRGNKGKKVVAAAGTISNFLGKDYVSDTSRKEVVKEKGFGCHGGGGGGCGGKVNNVEEAEQFLCSMLGDDCELGMAIVKDVLCSCGYEVEKALEVLLDLSASPSESSASDKYSNCSENSRYMDLSDSFWGSDSNSYCSESDVQDNMQFFNYTGRNYADALLSSNSSRKLGAENARMDGDELPQQLLESLFSMPKSAEHEPSTMNWKNVVKQMETFAQKRVGLGCTDSLPQHVITQAVAKGTEYQMFRGTAQQHWDKTRTCYNKAAAAFSSGEKNYARYMSEKAKLYSKMAREADEKASLEIFKTRNRGIQNSLTIDLHGQHVKQAMQVVKLHLLFATYISSVQYIRVITGCGSRGLGKSVVKQSVINLLKKERVAWSEENSGTVLIKLEGPREFSFLDSESDSEPE
ncbi:SMR domain-containing protein At5g58720 [Silene latifolia]|uniref:SMR domain-containing protein At5g58720 n=1 Tax=Silene latifolia TaxID=37657 RepID=UPI003D773E60